MIQLCGDSITLPLVQIFNSLQNQGVFPDTWKIANIIPVQKKEAKYLVKNYRPIRLLPILAKVFERLLFNSLFSLFHNNNLYPKCSSLFNPDDSCISQLLSIVDKIHLSFDYKPPTDVRLIFLDISKSFDKGLLYLWHQGLLFKLKSYGVEGNFLRLLENYLDKRKQRLVLDDQCSSWKIILSGVPQGSVLGPLLFLIYINDLPNGLNSICKIFVDDEFIFFKVFDKNKFQRDLNSNLYIISEWVFQ